jgi:large subunit ribosomal protein L19
MARLKGQALIASITNAYIKEVPEFSAGDTVKVFVKIKEGNRERIQLFEGLVIKRQGGGVSETFTVEKFLTVLVLSVLSHYIHLRLIISRYHVEVR